MDLSDAIQFARNRDTQHLLIESAGAFWLGAELVILFFVLAGRRHLESSPRLPDFQFTPAEKRRGLAWAGLFVVVTTAVLGRGLVVPSAHAMLETASLQESTSSLDLLPGMFVRRAHTHQAIWSLFVTGWVVFEVLIVWHGWMGYRRLRALLPPSLDRPKAKRSAGLLALALLLVPCAAVRAEPSALFELLREAHEADAPYRNALYLYLRVAGVAWIAVEWVAAVLLWRSYRLLKSAAAARRRSS